MKLDKFPLVVAGLMLLGGILNACADHSKFRDEPYVEICESEKVIRDIGTCDAQGKCRVRYDDMTFGIEDLPMQYRRVRVNCLIVPGKSKIPEDKKHWILVEGRDVWAR